MRIEPASTSTVERQLRIEFACCCFGIEFLAIDSFKPKPVSLVGKESIAVDFSRFSNPPADNAGQGGRLGLFYCLMRTCRFDGDGGIHDRESKRIRDAAARNKPQKMTFRARR